MISKKPTSKTPHPLAVVLSECFTLANTFEALAADARKDAREAQTEMERLEATVGFRRHGRVEYNDPSRELTPPGWSEQDRRLRQAKFLVEQCDSLAATLRESPRYIRNILDGLMAANEEAAAPAPKRKRPKARK
jgi:hypothetical protein